MYMITTFSIGSALGQAWKTANANRMLLLKVVLTIGALQVGSSIFNVKHVQTSTDVVIVLVGLVLSVLSAICTVGLLAISIKLVRGQRAAYEDIIPNWHIVWRFALVSIVSGVFIILGLVLLIIPGIYLMLRLSMAKMAVIENKHLKIFDALHQSTLMTHGVKWELLGLFLVLLLINILGAIPFGLGLLVTIPVSLLSVSHVYVILERRTHHSEAASEAA